MFVSLIFSWNNHSKNLQKKKSNNERGSLLQNPDLWTHPEGNNVLRGSKQAIRARRPVFKQSYILPSNDRRRRRRLLPTTYSAMSGCPRRVLTNGFASQVQSESLVCRVSKCRRRQTMYRLLFYFWFFCAGSALQCRTCLAYNIPVLDRGRRGVFSLILYNCSLDYLQMRLVF